MNFFPTVFGICRGTGTFPELVKRPLWRAAWHFLLMSLICGALIAWGRYGDTAGMLAAARGRVNAEFGSLAASGEGGLVPARGRDAAAGVIVNLPQPVAFCYTPDGAALPADFDRDANSGLVVSPRHIILWEKSLSTAISLGSAERAPFSHAAVAKMLDAPPRQTDAGNTMGDAFLRLWQSGSTLFGILFFSAWLLVLMWTVPVLALFSLVFGWFGSQRSAKLVTLRETAVLDIYAGFPAMLVATAFPALKLAYLDFNLVYSLGLVIYAMIAVNRVALGRLPRRGE